MGKSAVVAPRREHRVRGPILVPLAVALSLLLAAVLAGGIWLSHSESRSYACHLKEMVADFLRLAVRHQGEALAFGLDGIQGDPAFATAFAARDEARLLALAQPFYRRWRATFQVTHLDILAPDRTVLARLGDSFGPGGAAGGNRSTALEAARTGEIRTGLEIGPQGTLTVQAAVPYRDGDGAVLGYVEAGRAFGQIVEAIHDSIGVDVVTLLDKHLFERAGWEESARLSGWTNPWMRFPHVLVTNSTVPVLPAPVAARLATVPADGVIPPETFVLGGKTFYLATVPLAESGGRPVGSLLVIADVSARMARSRAFLAGFAVLCLVVGIGLVVLFHRLIGGVERRVGAALGRLARSNADLERMAYVVCDQLRGPLHSVVLACDHLDGAARPALTARAALHLDAVRDGVLSIREVTETLEDYLDLGVSGRPMEPVALAEVVAAALDLLQGALGEAEVEIGPLPVVAGHPVLLARAVFCLIERAVQGQDPDHRLHLAIAADGREGDWRLSFADDGPPLSPGQKAALTVDGADEADDGLGEEPTASALSVVALAARRHRGEVVCETAPDTGGTLIRLTMRTRLADGEGGAMKA